MRLTDLSVRALRGSDTYTTYFDDTLPGFGVRVGKRTKTWLVVRGKTRERLTIGRYPDMALTDARKEAKKLLANDNEPRPIRRTFREARDEFLETHYADKGENTKYQVRRSLTRHCTTLEPQQLADIDDQALKAVLDKLAATPSEQLHLFRYLRTFFRWCVRSPRRYLKHSPMEGYEPPGQDRRKTRILSDDEIIAVWNACQGRSDAAVRLMLLWGTRRTETTLLERSWSYQGVLTIPGFKDDQRITKNGRSHAIPICPLAAHVYPNHNHEYLFPGRWDEGHLTPRGLSEVVEGVQQRSGTSGWTPHDLRRTFRSLAARVGVPRDIAEILMNHTPAALDDIYDRHSYLPQKREALLKIEAALVWLLAAV